MDAVASALRSSSAAFKMTGENMPFGALFKNSGSTEVTVTDTANTVSAENNNDGDASNPTGSHNINVGNVGRWDTPYTLMDHVIEEIALTACEETDEGVQTQLLKILLTITTSTYCEVHGRSLLLAVR